MGPRLTRNVLAAAVSSACALAACEDDQTGTGGAASTTAATTATAVTAVTITSTTGATTSHSSSSDSSSSDSGSSSGSGGDGGAGGAGGDGGAGGGGVVANHLWSKRFGDAANQTGHAVASDPSGNVILGAYLSGSADFGGGVVSSAGGIDAAMVKLDPDGNHIWSRALGGAFDDRVDAIATDSSGNVIVVGTFGGTVDFGGGPFTSTGPVNTSAYVVKLDADGNHMWSKSFAGDAYQFATSVAIDADENVFVTGYFALTASFGGGPIAAAGAPGTTDIFLVKLDAAGNHIWSEAFGDDGDQLGLGVATDAGGNVIVTGRFDDSLDFGGGALTSVQGSDAFVAELDPSGSHVWSKQFGGQSVQLGRAVAADSTGDVLVAGRFRSTVDFGGGPLMSAGQEDVFVVKLDAAGSHVWSHRYGGSESESLASVAVDGSGSVLLLGENGFAPIDLGGGPLGPGIFVAKLDASGGHVWSVGYDAQHAYSMALDPSDNVLFSGGFLGVVDFGGGPLTSAGDWDVFLVKMGP